jgi:hypothetical protein
MPSNQLLKTPHHLLIALGVIITANTRYIIENIIRIAILTDNNIVGSDDDFDAINGINIDIFFNVSS